MEGAACAPRLRRDRALRRVRGAEPLFGVSVHSDDDRWRGRRCRQNERGLNCACSDGLLQSRQGPQRLCFPRGALDPAGGRGGGWRTEGARTPPRRPVGFESAALLSAVGAERFALKSCGRRSCAGVARGLGQGGGRRYPLVPPRRAATEAAPQSSTTFRPFGCSPSPSAGLPVRSLPPTPFSGAGAL